MPRRAPAAFRGRVISLFLVGLGTRYPLGALWQGLVGAAVRPAVGHHAGRRRPPRVLAGLAVLRPAALLALDPLPSGEPVDSVEG